jgi:predicted transcriptional regulator
MTSLIEELWAGYDGLTSPQKRVVFAMYWHGFTEVEVAETMGVSQSAISATLARAKGKLRKKLEGRLFFRAARPLYVMKEENGVAERGNGLVTNQAHSANKAPASFDHPASACPSPDIYLGSPQRDAFLEDLSYCSGAALMQLLDRYGYNERARANRERIARDREAAEAERRALRAA